MRWLNDRTRQILEFALHLSAPVSIAQIQEQFSVSRRTVYNEVDRANDWLRLSGLPLLQILQGKLEPPGSAAGARIAARLAEKEQNIYICSPLERVYLIICLVIARRDRILISTLMDTLEISRTTLLSDLKAVQSFLTGYSLTWKSQGRTGYTVEGDEMRRRALYLLLMTKLPGLPKQKILCDPWKQEIDECYARLKQIEQILKCEYIEEELYDLAALISAVKTGSNPIDLSELDQKRLQNNKEYETVSRCFPDFSPAEKMYITLHILGSRLAGFSAADLSADDQALMDITDSLIREFQTTACVEFENPKQLQTALFHHIKASRYRYKYGIQIGSPLEKNIRQEYPEVYRITRETVSYLEQALQVRISDAETAFLALHFGAFLSLPEPDDHLRILVVCVSGVSAANMIAREIRQMIPRAEIAGIHSLRTLVNPHTMADLIISSVEFQALIPVIRVHPVLTEEDRRNVLTHPLISAFLKRGDAATLFSRIKDLVDADKQELLKQRLDAYFSFQEPEAASMEDPGISGPLFQLLGNRIQFFREPCSWQDAILQTGDTLKESGQIEPQYLQTVIQRCLEHGAYMFVNNEVMIAHARPDEGVNQLCLSLGIFQEPAEFEGHRARFVFVLGAVDQTAHFPVLMEIRRLLKNPENRSQLGRCGDIDAFRSTARSILDQQSG